MGFYCFGVLVRVCNGDFQLGNLGLQIIDLHEYGKGIAGRALHTSKNPLLIVHEHDIDIWLIDLRRFSRFIPGVHAMHILGYLR
ncbi:hypothetical protein D3C80_2033850 [compost metagenome]